MSFQKVSCVVLLGLFMAAIAVDPRCSGTATYRVLFENRLTPANFGSLIPETGLVFGPFAAISHSNRQSFLTVRGFASRAVERVAELGDVSMLQRRARRLQRRGQGVLTVTDSGGELINPGLKDVAEIQVDCNHTFVTALGMIAPSPDWFVQISNMNLFDSETGDFVATRTGELIAYDAGTDDSRDFTSPADLSLDMPTVPQQNIAPLVEDETDRFEGRAVGEYLIARLS